MSLQLKIIFLSLFSIYCLLKILEMLEIYLYTLMHSQLSNQMWQKRAADPTCAASLDTGILHNT